MHPDKAKRIAKRVQDNRAIGYGIAEDLLDEAHRGEFDNHPTLGEHLRSISDRWYNSDSTDVRSFLSSNDRQVLEQTVSDIHKRDPKAFSVDEADYVRFAMREQLDIPSSPDAVPPQMNDAGQSQHKLKRGTRRPLTFTTTEPEGPSVRPPAPAPRQPAEERQPTGQETPQAQPQTENDWWEETRKFAGSPELWTHMAALGAGGVGGAALANMLNNPAAIPASMESPYGV